MMFGNFDKLEKKPLVDMDNLAGHVRENTEVQMEREQKDKSFRVISGIGGVLGLGAVATGAYLENECLVGFGTGMVMMDTLCYAASYYTGKYLKKRRDN